MSILEFSIYKPILRRPAGRCYWRWQRLQNLYHRRDNSGFHQLSLTFIKWAKRQKKILPLVHLNLFRNSIHSDSIHSLKHSFKASCSRLELNPNQFTSLKLTILNILPKYIFTQKLTQFMNKFIETTNWFGPWGNCFIGLKVHYNTISCQHCATRTRVLPASPVKIILSKIGWISTFGTMLNW